MKKTLRRAALEYVLGHRRCKECGEGIRWTNEDSRRQVCDDCFDARQLAQMYRASKAMVEVFKKAGPKPDTHELSKALLTALRESLKEERS